MNWYWSWIGKNTWNFPPPYKWPFIPAVVVTHTQTYRLHTATQWEYITHPVGSCLMLTQRNISSSLTLRACARESHGLQHVCEWNIQCIVIITLFLYFTYSFSLFIILGVHMCVCVCVFTCRIRILSFFFGSQSPANLVSMETGGGIGRLWCWLPDTVCPMGHQLSATPHVRRPMCACVCIFFSPLTSIIYKLDPTWISLKIRRPGACGFLRSKYELFLVDSFEDCCFCALSV